MSLNPILIAEDEAPLRTLLAGLLEARGLGSLEAGDGQDALAVLKANPSVQLLLSDVKMPGMTGYELVEEALVFRPELKVLMMTGYAADLPPSPALKAREIRTLTKPFDPERMVELVFQMLGRP